MNFGRGQYVGVLLTDTEFGSDYNRVVGGDVVFKRGAHFQANGSFLVFDSRVDRRESEQWQRLAGLLRLQHAGVSRLPASWNITTAASGWIRHSSIASA